MHLSALYTTGPSPDLLMAPTGHAEAQAGSSQCMQTLRTNLPPRGSTTLNAVSERVGSGSVLNPWSCLQAVSQLRHPMQSLISMSIAFLVAMVSSLGPDLCYVRKNSFASWCCTLASTWKNRPLIGRPPSCARAGVSCCSLAPRRAMLFCIQTATRLPCSRFLVLMASSGALITHSHPLLYGSSTMRLGSFST